MRGSRLLTEGFLEGAGRHAFDVLETNGPEMEAAFREKLLVEFHSPYFKDLPAAAFPAHRGWVADRFGRRINAIGFFIAAAMIVAYLRAPGDLALLKGLGFVYGFAISAGVAWGVYFAELYPAHLRSTAASIFHWGRILSFFAPAVTAAVADAAGLTTGMMLASLLYLLAGGVWLMLPETLLRKAAP